MHHGRMFSSQWIQVLSQLAGTSFRAPSRCAASARCAIELTSRNHWTEISGSIGTPLRWQWPTLWT
jgi:hypothetical protein